LPASSDHSELAPSLSAKIMANALLSADLLEALPDAVIAVDREGTIVQVNSQTQALFGYDRDELIGQKVEMLVPESFRQQHHHHRDNFARTPKTRRMGADLDLYGRCRNGSEFPVEISLSPILTDRGPFVLSAIRDISDRKRIAGELRRANEELHRRTTEQLGEYRSRLALIIDSSEDAILSKDLNGTITSWNKGAERIYGYTPEEVVGKHIALLIPADRPDEIPQILRKIARGERIDHHESVRVAKDGRRLDVFVSVSPLRNAAGDVVGASVIARDVTAQKRAEAQLRQSQKMEAIGRLAGGVAHDFNNLLLVISAYAELMLDSLGETDPLRRNVAEIIGASRRAADLTRQLLAFGRKQMQSLQILDLNAVIGEITGMLPRLIGEDIELEFVRGQDLGKVKADPMQIEQVLMNLAANARDAMPSGGRLTIETSTVRVEESYVQRHAIVPSGDYVLLTVTDSGQGIAPEHLAHIFEPFYTTKEAGKGTGLGLATVYGIVKQNGGFVWVYSELGLGTTFKVYLPQVQPLTTQVPIAKLAERSPRGSETLLLVEDEISVRLASSQFLTRNGYSVLEAGNGEEALRLSRAHAGTIELMITDVVMPKMGGPALAEWLADERPNMKVLFVSGYAENTVLRHGRVDVASRFLQKPFSGKMLARKVREILEESETRSLETISRGLRKAD